MQIISLNVLRITHLKLMTSSSKLKEVSWSLEALKFWLSFLVCACAPFFLHIFFFFFSKFVMIIKNDLGSLLFGLFILPHVPVSYPRHSVISHGYDIWTMFFGPKLLFFYNLAESDPWIRLCA